MPGAVIPAWTRESRRHACPRPRAGGRQTNKAAGIGFVAETLNRHSGDSRSPESFFNFTPHPKPATLPSTNHSFASINATVIYFYTNFQPPPERTNDQSSQDDARPQRRVHRIESVESIHVESNRRIESVESIRVASNRRFESVESIHVESNRRIESVESIHTEIICAESSRVESIAIIHIESSRVESVESICVESIHAEIICAEIIRVEIIRGASNHIESNRIENIIRKQTQTPTQHRKRRALCRD